MSLSICFITRNAEQSIERALRSIADLQAEVLVGDTGSTDGTVATARRLGARIVDIAWADDFAAAQNQTLAEATGEWILWLNPDEELLPEARAQLPALLARSDALAYAVRVQEVMRPDQPDGATESVHPRLFRRHPEVRFVGRLHPHFEVPLEELARRENKSIFGADFKIRHHAYQSVLTPDKLRWARRLLELELKDRPGQLHYLIEYGRNLLRLNDPQGHAVLAEASQQVMAVADAPAPPEATVASLLEYLLTVSPEQSRSALSAVHARELALRWFPNSPPLLWVLAQAAFQANDYQQSAGFLEKLVQLGRTGSYDRSAAFDPSLMAEPAVLNLGNCYLRLGDAERAERCFTQLLTSPTHGTQARQGYTLVQGLRSRASRS